MRFSFLSVLVILLVSCTSGDESVTSPHDMSLWPLMDSESSTEYPLPSRGDGVVRLTDVNQPSLTVFPAQGDEPVPAVLIFPGGGYAYMAVNKEGSAVAEWLNRIGVTAVLVQYSVPDKREDAFRDGRRAIRLVRFYARDWNIDPGRVGVMGFSAGGHLSTRLSTDFNNENYELIDEADKLSARPDFSMLIYPAYLDNENGERLADEISVTNEIPPTFMVQTKDDQNYVGGTILYDQALDSVDVSKTFHLFEQGGHGYGLEASPEYEVSKWPELAEEWMILQGIIEN